MSWAREMFAYLRDPSVRWWRKTGAGLALLYVLIPTDLIFDALPVVGWLDDLGVVGLAVTYFVRQVRRHASQRQAGAPERAGGKA